MSRYRRYPRYLFDLPLTSSSVVTLIHHKQTLPDNILRARKDISVFATVPALRMDAHAGTQLLVTPTRGSLCSRTRRGSLLVCSLL